MIDRKKQKRRNRRGGFLFPVSSSTLPPEQKYDKKIKTHVRSDVQRAKWAWSESTPQLLTHESTRPALDSRLTAHLLSRVRGKNAGVIDRFSSRARRVSDSPPAVSPRCLVGGLAERAGGLQPWSLPLTAF
ncbi:hypothetical protein BgiMline_008533 [Biomphalaria glabrata]|nr:hypothetical protein BgiMline_019212 [Biomphalaria glabrata]